jgi:hypothetical protein
VWTDTPQGGENAGKAADDVLMVDQGQRFFLTTQAKYFMVQPKKGA